MGRGAAMEPEEPPLLEEVLEEEEVVDCGGKRREVVLVGPSRWRINGRRRRPRG